MDAEIRAEILHVLQSGTMEIEGILPWSSNYAFLVNVCAEAAEFRAVYKPSRGERPLWDFPHGTLSEREYAAFLISSELGWDLVPPTVLRRGEHGTGTVQLFIEHDPNQHYFTFEGQPLFRAPLQKTVLLDVVINNADRKGGHVIIEESLPADAAQAAIGPGRLWGIDHGICFRHEYKLRTVIWEWAGDAIPQAMLDDLVEFLDGGLDDELAELLDAFERDATLTRARAVIAEGHFPTDPTGRRHPWPLL